jgi:hypothetical protein
MCRIRDASRPVCFSPKVPTGVHFGQAMDSRWKLPVEGWTAVTYVNCLVMCRCVHSVLGMV